MKLISQLQEMVESCLFKCREQLLCCFSSITQLVHIIVVCVYNSRAQRSAGSGCSRCGCRCLCNVDFLTYLAFHTFFCTELFVPFKVFYWTFQLFFWFRVLCWFQHSSAPFSFFVLMSAFFTFFFKFNFFLQP